MAPNDQTLGNNELEAAHENEPRLAVPSCHGRRLIAKHQLI